MKFTILATALAAVKAEPDFAADAADIVAEHQGGDEANDFQPAKFTVYGEDQIAVYINGVNVISGAYHSRDPSTWAFSSDVSWRPSFDTVAVEVDAFRGDGLWTGVFGEYVVNHADWKCIEIHDPAQIPSNWADNDYNDDGWSAPTVQGDNTPMGGPMWWRGWTNANFPANAEYLWVQDWTATKALCRWNQRSTEERNADSGECQPVMDAFLSLINQTIGHYNVVIEGLENDISIRQQTQEELYETLVYTQDTLQATQDGLAAEIEGREADNQAWQAEWDATKEAHKAYANQVQNTLTQQCAADIESAENELINSYEQHINEIWANHEQQVADTQAEHASITEQELNAQENHLNNLHDDAVNQQWLEHENHQNELNNHHANEVAQLQEAFANAESDLRAQNADALQAQADEHANQIQSLADEFQRIFDETNASHDSQLQANIAEWERKISEQAQAFGEEIDTLTKKHDYLYEACTTVQVVDGELHIAE